MALQKVKAVLFDLDGTLLDTVKDIGTGANLALCRYGCPKYPLDAYRAFVGHGIRKLFGLIVPKGTSDADFESILQYYLQYYPEHCTDRTTEFPGIRRMLAALQAAGYTLAVISNKTEKTSRKIIGHYFPEIDFRFVWGNNGTRPLKPDPAAGALACQTLGLTPEEILYFGDGDTDMAFGSAAGFFAVGCAWGYRDADCLRKNGARAVVETAEALLEMLGVEA
ncbi:MAG: HAD-IA family hydrolase [Oscillospiraceae bacterium]|nr:HAD-IA family hydrolase [Oscillospiraceae bacterium]